MKRNLGFKMEFPISILFLIFFLSSLYEPKITPQIVELKGNVLITVKIQHGSIISVLTTLNRGSLECYENLPINVIL